MTSKGNFNVVGELSSLNNLCVQDLGPIVSWEISFKNYMYNTCYMTSHDLKASSDGILGVIAELAMSNNPRMQEIGHG